MYEELTVVEQRNQRKSRNYSIAIHVILLLLLFIFGRFQDDPDESIDEQYAVAIDFTFDKSSNSTSGREKAGGPPAQAEKEERAKEAEIQEDVPAIREVIEELQEEPVEEEIVDEAVQEVPDPIDPVVEDIVEEDSPIEAVEDIELEQPEKDPVPDIPAKDIPVSKPKPSTSKPSSSGSGSGSNNTSTKPSTGNPGSGSSTSGSGSGKDDSGNDGNSGVGTGGLGTGAYDDSGNGIFGRRIIKTPSLGTIMSQKVTGKIVIKMCVNPRGQVIHTELNRKETTIRDKALMKEALRVAKNYLYEKDIDAPAEQCGKFTFRLDINGLY